MQEQVLELVNLSWLAFVQIPRGQMGKNKYQKATASQRNARCVIFSDLFDLFGLLQNRPLDFDFVRFVRFRPTWWSSNSRLLPATLETSKWQVEAVEPAVSTSQCQF